MPPQSGRPPDRAHWRTITPAPISATASRSSTTAAPSVAPAPIEPRYHAPGHAPHRAPTYAPMAGQPVIYPQTGPNNGPPQGPLPPGAYYGYSYYPGRPPVLGIYYPTPNGAHTGVPASPAYHHPPATKRHSEPRPVHSPASSRLLPPPRGLARPSTSVGRENPDAPLTKKARCSSPYGGVPSSAPVSTATRPAASHAPPSAAGAYRDRAREPSPDVVCLSDLPRKDSVMAYEHKRYMPSVCWRNHPKCGIGKNFHSVPYPLGLMPHDNWSRLHHRSCDHAVKRPNFSCPQCYKDRGAPSAHKQKLFLVAERLSWEDGVVPTSDRSRNEELNWEVNFKLGIIEPAVEDPEQVPGGKMSRNNQWYPFASMEDFEAAMSLVASVDELTERSWKIWLRMMDALGEYVNGAAEVDDTSSPPVAATPQPNPHQRHEDSRVARRPLQETTGNHLPSHAPSSTAKAPSSSTPTSQTSSEAPITTGVSASAASSQAPPGAEPTPPQSACTSFRSLPEFYSLLDRIERTSFVGAKLLEAYATHLTKEVCADCWHAKYTQS